MMAGPAPRVASDQRRRDPAGTTMTVAQIAANTIVLATLSALAITPLYSAYQSSDFWIAAGGGILLGTALAVLAARLRWAALSVAALTVVVYFAFGGALVFRDEALFGVLPNLDVLASLAVGAVHVWKDLLTLQAPFAGFDELALAPYILGLVVSVVTVSLGLRLSRPAWSLVPVAALLLFSIVLSTYTAFHPAWVGAAAAAVALVWLAWRAHLARITSTMPLPDEPGASAPSRRTWGAAAVGALLVVLVAGAAGGVAASALTGADRVVLRDHVVPPLELHDYASPLTAFRKYAVADKETVLFTLSGLRAGDRVRLAALDLYDGVVYKVSGAGGAGSGEFSRVGRQIAAAQDGASVSITVEAGELGGIWVPTVGEVTSISADGAAAEIWPQALHYNSATGTAIVTSGLAAGDTYSFEAIVPATPTAEELDSATISRITTPIAAEVPAETTALIDEVTADAETPLAQVRALAQYLHDEGRFTHGDNGFPSPSGHFVQRISALLSGDQMVGDDEQYAVAMALMVSQLGVPVRVVMGFTPQSEGATVAVTGDDLHAWVEVPLDGYGWVAFDPTPSDEREPLPEVQQQAQKPRVQVPQPPETPQEPAELPPAPPVEEASSGEQPTDLGWLWLSMQIGGGLLILLLILFGPSLAFAIARLRRRKARRRADSGADRLGGGWSELIDSATDVGTPTGVGATRREQAARLDERYPDAGMSALAHRADVAVFGAADPTRAEVDAYWADVNTAVKRIGAATPWYRRLRASMFPASVLSRASRSGESR